MSGRKLFALLAAALMTFAAAGSAMAATIEANPGKININDLEDRYITTDIDYRGDGVVILTLKENEQFDGEAVKAIQAGDVIRSDGQEIKVDTVTWDGPDLVINVGTAEEARLCDAGDGLFGGVRGAEEGSPDGFDGHRASSFSFCFLLAFIIG